MLRRRISRRVTIDVVSMGRLQCRPRTTCISVIERKIDYIHRLESDICIDVRELRCELDPELGVRAIGRMDEPRASNVESYGCHDCMMTSTAF